MNKLTIIDVKGKQLIDARELHRKLEVGRMYAHWITERINRYGFQKDEDYFEESSLLAKFGKQIDKSKNFTNIGGHNKLNIFITTTMAKELCLLERNEIGREYRRYLIRTEEKARELFSRFIKTEMIGNVECIRYEGWLLLNGYSLISSRVGYRLRKHPEQFKKTDKGWYMTREISEYFLGYKRMQEGKFEKIEKGVQESLKLI